MSLSAQTSFRFLNDNNLPGSSEEETWWKGKCLHFTILLIVTTDLFRCQVSDSVPGNQITWNLYHSQVSALQSIILGIHECNDFHFAQVYCTANIALVKLFSCLCAVKLEKNPQHQNYIKYKNQWICKTWEKSGNESIERKWQPG